MTAKMTLTLSLPMRIDELVKKSIDFFKHHELKFKILDQQILASGEQRLVVKLDKSPIKAKPPLKDIHLYTISFTFSRVGDKIVVQVESDVESFLHGAMQLNDLQQWGLSIGIPDILLDFFLEKRGSTEAINLGIYKLDYSFLAQKMGYKIDPLIFDDIFMDQAGNEKNINSFSRDDWDKIEQSLNEYFKLLLEKLMSGEEARTRKIVTDLSTIDPRTVPRSDTAAKIEAFIRFKKGGYVHPEQLPRFYEEEINKMKTQSKETMESLSRIEPVDLGEKQAKRVNTTGLDLGSAYCDPITTLDKNMKNPPPSMKSEILTQFWEAFNQAKAGKCSYQKAIYWFVDIIKTFNLYTVKITNAIPVIMFAELYFLASREPFYFDYLRGMDNIVGAPFNGGGGRLFDAAYYVKTLNEQLLIDFYKIISYLLNKGVGTLAHVNFYLSEFLAVCHHFKKDMLNIIWDFGPILALVNDAMDDPSNITALKAMVACMEGQAPVTSLEAIQFKTLEPRWDEEYSKKYKTMPARAPARETRRFKVD